MPTLQELLDRSRLELLDLSNRNRLISLPVKSSRARLIHMHDERSDQVFDVLMHRRNKMTFLAGKEAPPPDDSEDDDGLFSLAQPGDEDLTPDSDPQRHTDTRLQTALTSQSLQTKLLGFYRDAKTAIEEQGVNILYLTLGRLKWYESEDADTERYAPLILLPVTLGRRNAQDRFSLAWDEEEIQANSCLGEKLIRDFGITLPDLPTDEDIVPSEYMARVARAVAGRPNWEVEADAITLGLLSFAKYLMFRDLDAAIWPEETPLLGENLTNLITDGFPSGDDLFPDDVHIDELIPAEDLDHVVDSDTSQTMALERVRAGRNLVVQGPPGTGKSQSIVNMIAVAVLEGKRVLFVAEKAAALEVVKRRMENEGLGDLCLELHSHKTKKKAVLDELKSTWNRQKPGAHDVEGNVQRLESIRGRLNAHPRTLHQPIGSAGVTTFRALGELAQLNGCRDRFEPLPLEGYLDWNRDGVRERREVIKELAGRGAAMGPPSQNPWRGAERETLLNFDLPPLGQKLDQMASAVATMRETAGRIAATLRQVDPERFGHVEAVRLMAAHVAAAPELDPACLCNQVWNSGLEQLQAIITHGKEFRKTRSSLEGWVGPDAFNHDVHPARQAVAEHGLKWYRIFIREYRDGMGVLRDVLLIKPPRPHPERVGLFDLILKGRQHLQAIRDADSLAMSAFGSLWQRENSDWEKLEAILAWVNGETEACVAPGFREAFAGLEDRTSFGVESQALGDQLGVAWSATSDIVDELKLNLEAAFGEQELHAIPLASLEERLTEWRQDLEGLSRWNAWHICASRAHELALGGLVQAANEGTVHCGDLPDCFDFSYYMALFRAAVQRDPSIAQFNGVHHDALVEDFREVDRQRLATAAHKVKLKHHAGLPKRHNDDTGVRLLRNQMELNRGHLPVRQLLKRAGRAIQAIKPIFMMSPMSVAQFLEPGALDFDLLVIDEASQVKPVDAFGALARTGQFVVIGDSKQLPPTEFFAKVTGGGSDGTDAEEPEDESDKDDQVVEVPSVEAQEMESILSLCAARNVYSEMLRWHYRSRHHSLIAVSNQAFYDSELFIVPNPSESHPDLGLRFHYVEDGVYDRGKSATNRNEARAVCRAVLEHAQKCPDLSLGVAAFSKKQEQMILDELELFRREQPELDEFISRGRPDDPFFVKNLENVQGDDRDVIFISVGYGPDASGYMTMNFGPLGRFGGERRLNVLISRAKQRCHVFSSFRSDKIDLNRAKNPGVAAFKMYLHYAESGILDKPPRSEGEEMSPFEVAVRRAVEGLGYKVDAQVGVAGFFIDLCVVDPEEPGRYVLGIECDGATYHSSRSARERDRLRQAVLEDHGWIIHRIWSTDWFQRPQEQLRKVETVIAKGLLVRTS